MHHLTAAVLSFVAGDVLHLQVLCHAAGVLIGSSADHVCKGLSTSRFGQPRQQSSSRVLALCVQSHVSVAVGANWTSCAFAHCLVVHVLSGNQWNNQTNAVHTTDCADPQRISSYRLATKLHQCLHSLRSSASLHAA